MRNRLRAALQSSISMPTLIAIILIVVAAYISEESSLRRIEPILSIELFVHRILSRLDWRQQKSKFVTVVEVDDAAFWHPPFSGVQPTNRHALADVALAAAKQGATVIAFDFAWKAPDWHPGDDNIRTKDNGYLLQTVSQIASGKGLPRPVPIVVTTGLVDNKQGAWIREPNIFDDSAFQKAGATVGHINLPWDPRQIPLDMKAWEWNSQYEREFDSLGLQIARAYEMAAHITPSVTEVGAIRTAIGSDKFVYGGFLERDAFPVVSATDMLASSGKARFCANRIVLIGGTWHEYSEGNGPLIESFRSSVGSVPGVYLHANYVESLLDGRFNSAVPPWLAVLVDLILAAFLTIAVRIPKKFLSRVTLLLVLLCPIFFAYVVSASLGLYLDFVVALLLLIIHLVIEHYRGEPVVS